MLQSDSGPAKSVPASYRIGLALSLALMSHIILLTGLPSPLLEATNLSQRLVFTLSSSSSHSSTSNTPEPSTQETLRHSEFSVEPQNLPVTTQKSEKSSHVDPQTSNSASQPQNVRQVSTNVQTSPAATVSAQSAPMETPATQNAGKTQRITKSPAEQDPYLIKLAVHLAEELEKLRVPALSQLDTTREMTLELRILANGALTRARVKETTGIENIDRAAYRAALAASPYPQPEGETSDHFDVKLVFTPKQQ